MSLYPGYLEYGQSDRKVYLKGREEKENSKNKSLLPVKIITGLWQGGLI